MSSETPSKTPASVQPTLERCMDDLKTRRKETFDFDDLGKIIENLLGTLTAHAPPAGVHTEIESLGSYIARAKREISEIQPEDIAQRHIPVASDELGAIGVHLEEATEVILDACEEVEAACQGLDDERSQRLGEAVNRIYGACNFQDLTGQRITKIVDMLHEIESRVDRLLKAFGQSREPASTEGRKDASANAKRSDDGLLNGPQLPGNGVSQQDIDTLLASF